MPKRISHKITPPKKKQRKHHFSFTDWIRHWKGRYGAEARRRFDQVCSLVTYHAACGGIENEEPELLSLGNMDVECVRGCGALHFAGESLVSKCCDCNGHGPFEALAPLPRHLLELLHNADFRRNIRTYNNTFCMSTLGATFGSKIDRATTGFPYYFRICGGIYHSIPPLFANNNALPRFSQVYVLETSLMQLQTRMQVAPREVSMDFNTVSWLQQYLNANNPYVPSLRSAASLIRQHGAKTVTIEMTARPGKTFSLPQVDEIAVFIQDDSTAADQYRSVQLCDQSGGFRTINELNPMYDPTHYVLMFPHGEKGWSLSDDGGITVQQHYQRLLQVRPTLEHPIESFGKLSHEYYVDMYAKTVKRRLDYIRTHQVELRASLYESVQDYTFSHDQSDSLEHQGRSVVILPGTVTGTPRWYRSLYLDGMNMVNDLGATTALITMTCNPRWKEILDNLNPGEQPQDRPDLLVRVFRMKSQELLDDIIKHHVIGHCIGILAANEFQKKGLPHIHVLVILNSIDRPRNGTDCDRIACAEIPDRDAHPRLHSIVVRHMLHGPCSRRYCLDDKGVCSKGYRMSFREETEFDGLTRVKWRRPDNGSFYETRGFRFDNRDVVPYNPYLLLKYDCHINVEVTSSKIGSIRYLFGYLLKGEDKAAIKVLQKEWIDQGILNATDEVAMYRSGKYAGSTEALWRIFEYPIIITHPSTIRLPVHLPNRQVLFDPRRQRREGESIPEPKKTKLESFFECMQVGNTTESIFYRDAPKFFVWDNDTLEWHIRQRLPDSGRILSRLQHCSVKQGERYYLRLLLNHVPNPTSFDYLKTVDGILYPSFQEACSKRGLLDNDQQWYDTLNEAALYYNSKKVREIFAYILVYGEPSNPRALWESNIRNTNFINDFIHDGTSNPTTQALIHLDQVLRDFDKRLTDYEGIMPQLPERPVERFDSINLTAEARAEHQRDYETTMSLANDEQALFLNSALTALQNNTQFLAKLIAIAGSGKTYCLRDGLQNYLYATTGSTYSCRAVASTAIAAAMYYHGSTAHSAFKFPVEYDHADQVRSGISLDSAEAARLKLTKLLIWDEAFGNPREFAEAADLFFRDLMGEPTKLFGGISVIFAGDNRQTLSKHRGATRAQIINALPTKSTIIGPHLQEFQLKRNMRIDSTDPHAEAFADFMLQIGENIYPHTRQSDIQFPEWIHQSHNVNELIEYIYGNEDELNELNSEELASRAILAPINVSVRELNEKILDKIHGRERTYLSVDTELDLNDDVVDDLSSEVLGGIQPPGMPPHKLRLRIGCVVMCVRNLKDGVKNGTKMRVTNFGNNILTLRILTGSRAGQYEDMPRIVLTKKFDTGTGKLRRRQFPLVLAYAMTIDKSQGQSLKRIGAYLMTPAFAHGQLYTCISRAIHSRNFTYLLPLDDTTTKNIVWHEAFD